MEYYSAMKRNKLLTQTAAEMNLTGIMLSERSQSQKVGTVYHSILKGKITVMKNRSLIARGGGWEEAMEIKGKHKAALLFPNFYGGYTNLYMC